MELLFTKTTLAVQATWRPASGWLARCGRRSFCGSRRYPAVFVGGLRKTTKNILNRNSRYPGQDFYCVTWELSDARHKPYSLVPFDFPSGIFPRSPPCAGSCYRFSHKHFNYSNNFAAVSLLHLFYSILCSVCQQWRRGAQDGRICSATLTTRRKTHQIPAPVSLLRNQIYEQ